MTEHKRILIIGGGHIGLVCATYLARAGRKVLLLEAAPRVGGAAITREFAQGFKVSAGAHLLHLLNPQIEKELELARHGLSYARTSLKTVSLSETGEPLVLDGAIVVAGKVSASDQAALASHMARMQKFARVVARQHGRIPARLAPGNWRAALTAAALAFDIRRLGRKDMREFLRLATMNIFDVLEDNFDSAQLKGALALDGVLGTKLGPRSGNTVFNSWYRASGDAGGRAGSFALPAGGMGAVTQALAAAAQAAGVEIRLSSPVAAVLLNGDRVSGVRLENGETLTAAVVVSNADPKTTLMQLLGARHLETEFARRVHNLRAVGTAAKLHLALSGVPGFRGLPAEHAGERLLIAPDLGYIERAFNPAKYREFSSEPVLEITLPSVHDASLAPAGKHVLSAIVQYAPHDIAGGWETQRERFAAATLAVLERYAPGLRAQIIASELLTPLDIEREFRIAGGHWHHGELSLDQFMMLRPVAGASQYAMPVTGLYLCGAGCHPGGGVMGSAGRNAARVILKSRQAA
jgi:phytoene dehydrogenase-like protein